MAIIEFAHITLAQGLTASDPKPLENLKEVKQVIEEYSKLTTLFYVDVNNSNVMYVVGAWENQAKHMNGFDGSPEQSSILGLIKDQMGIDWMHYLNIEQQSIDLDALVLTAVKLKFLQAKVEKSVAESELVRSTSKAVKSVYGWSLPKDENEDDFLVQFSGCKSMDEASSFTESILRNPSLQQQSQAMYVMFMRKVEI